MKIAVAQVQSHTDKNENLKKVSKYVEKAKQEGANFVVFPEGFMANPSAANVMPAEVSESLDGPFITELSNIAKSNQMYIICGFFETDPNDDNSCYNTAVFIDKKGEILHNYRKTHLFDAFSSKESDRFLIGSEPPKVIETEYGNIGLIICYELRFPELSRNLALQNADVIIIPTAWASGTLKEYQWETLLKARAIENTIYIVGADSIGENKAGNSMIVDPMGVVKANAGEEETLIFADVNLERIKNVRNKLPSLTHLRPELY